MNRIRGWWRRRRLTRARRRARARIDPFAVGERWRPFVRSALQARARYHDVVAGVAPGPLRERLGDIGRRIDEAVDDCWQVARRGHELDRARRTLDPALPQAERLARRADGAHERLSELDRQLEGAVARAVELAATAGDPLVLGPVRGDVERLVDELEALRQGLDELG